MTPLLDVIDLKVHFRLARQRLFAPRKTLVAVGGVSFRVDEGQNVAIVGESGSGKTTVANAVLGLVEPTAGEILLQAETQMVFQDPFSSLNPRFSVERLVAEPLKIKEPTLSRPERRTRIIRVLKDVGLGEDSLEKFPHEFSGGQRQRIAIARAIVTEPQLLIADEPVSALDVSVQAQVLNVLLEQQQRRNFSLLMISHDMAVVRHVADWVVVMRQGLVEEAGPTEALFNDPQTAYAKRLIAAIPKVDPSAREKQRAEIFR